MANDSDVNERVDRLDRALDVQPALPLFLRDEIAIVAMREFLRSRDRGSSAADLAERCYYLADAMMVARANSQPKT